ncbi:MAG: hypothetical protein AAFR51_15950 [Pseudomonadota bacterium]
MSAITTTSDVLDEALRAAGLDEAFDDRGQAFEDCPGCGASRGLKLSLARGSVQCGACGSSGPLLTYLREKADASDWNHEPFSEAEIIPIAPRLDRLTDPVTGRVQEDDTKATQMPLTVTSPAPPTDAIETRFIGEVEIDQAPFRPQSSGQSPGQSSAQNSGRLGERIIITLLALIFLSAGLAAAALSGFANFQAFSLGVADPAQAKVWGWSGVIASICSFGGFTFFWWHMSGGRRGEALRALVFALAGAGTSVAGTSLFMMNNAQGQLTSWQMSEQLQTLTLSEIDDWTRQLEGIPAETRSIAGLEAYLAGVEAAGRAHQKPYRDAQNELGLAQRRAALEANIAAARDRLRTAVQTRASAPPAQSLPAWFFALMLELFSSQATSIAFVSLLLLYGRAHAAVTDDAIVPV